MKFCLGILSFFLALALVKCEEIPEKLKAIYEECGKEVGVDLEEIFKSPPNFDDPKTKCFFACFLKKGESLVNGKVIVEKTIEYAEKILPKGATDSIKADITACADEANEEGKDECEVGGAFEKCMIEKPPRL